MSKPGPLKSKPDPNAEPVPTGWRARLPKFAKWSLIPFAYYLTFHVQWQFAGRGTVDDYENILSPLRRWHTNVIRRLKGEEPVQYDASKIGLRGAVEEDKRRKKAIQEAEDTQRRNLLRMLEKIELKGLEKVVKMDPSLGSASLPAIPSASSKKT